jgi:hypothetical protein
MEKRNLLSTLLTVLLALNASCACAAMVVDPDAGSHAHHQQPLADTAPSADCRSDCEDCEKAAGIGLGKETSQPPSLKFGLDDIEWSTIDVAPYGLGSTTQATGPPFDLISQATSTPVRRFDLQLK